MKKSNTKPTARKPAPQRGGTRTPPKRARLHRKAPGGRTRTGTARATLAAIGVKLRQMDLWGPIRQGVRIAQKTVKHTPVQKLMDAFIGLLAGVQGLVEINHRLRNDPGLQQAFGREGCAEQSVIQETLDRCTGETVMQMEVALGRIFQKHSRGYRHDYQAGWQLLDVDVSGMPCGKKAAFATKGYFAHARNRRGRQLGRVVATLYQEIVGDHLFDGTTQLPTALRPLVLAAERTLGLAATQRARTILRMDSGGGSVEEVNWVLGRGYQVHCKDYSSQRAAHLAESVPAWVDDPKHPGRQVGWVTLPPTEYVREVRRIAVRCRKANGQWGIGVLLSTLLERDVIALTGQPCHQVHDPRAVLLAYVYFYDLRGGGLETTLKDDKGLGLTKRNKQRFPAQQMLVLLSALAYNVTIWSREWLAPHCPKVAAYGRLRLVRDVLAIRGDLVFDHEQHLVQILLNQADTLARSLLPGFQALLASEHVAVNLGKT